MPFVGLLSPVLNHCYRYKCDSVQFPRLALPRTLGGPPCLDEYPPTIHVYFVRPNGSDPSTGFYTPRLIIPRECTVKLIRTIIINSLPTDIKTHSIEFFTGCSGTVMGWHASGNPTSPVLLDWQSDKVAGIADGQSIFVAVKVLDPASGIMVLIDPFPAPAYPPRILMWNASCV